MTEPIDFAELVDWVEGRLDPDTDAAVAARLATTDDRTRRTVEWLQTFLAASRALPLHEPPPIVRQNLRRHFARAGGAARAALDDTPLKLTARLLFDSRHDLALAGARAVETTGDTRHLAYTSERADVVIDVRQLAGGRVRIDGQVLLVDVSEAPVFEATIRGPGIELRSVAGDAFGRFRFEDVPESIAELQVTNGDIALILAIELDEQQL